MIFTDLIVYTCLVFWVLYVTRVNNMWGVQKGTKKAREDAKQEKNFVILRDRESKRLGWYLWFGTNFGATVSEYKKKQYEYLISRVDVKTKYLNRQLEPLELIGRMRLATVITVFLAAVGFSLTWSLFFLIGIIGFFYPLFFTVSANAKIAKEDRELEEEFPDFFLILYNRLLQGTKARLMPTIRDYLTSLDAMKNQEETSVIRQFVVDLRNNIEVFGDDSKAVMALRDKYRSVMVINFCNLAVQALRGVDNSDKLQSFKMELNQRRLSTLKKRSDYAVMKGGIAVRFVYVILAQFIILSFAAKLSVSLGGIRNILGF